MKANIPPYPKASRLKLSEYEQRQSWLKPLLDAYFIIDQEGQIHKYAKVMLDLNWDNLVVKMQNKDNK